MNTVRVAHPGPGLLRDFGLGLLNDAESAGIEQHLGDCTSCQALVDSLPPDALVSLLRQSSVRGVVPTQPGGPEDTKLPGAASPVVEAVPTELANHPRYRIVDVLGRGGMGAVFKAEHRLMRRVVALKVIRADLVERPGTVERFRREVQAAAQLAHPNIVTAYDAEQAGGIHFLVMEHVEGTNLADFVKERGPMSIQQACICARQTALGLQHALERGMVHRDIKPQNLLLTPAGWIKVLDFGLARFVREITAGEGEAAGLTQSGTIMGTPDFMAPEQADDPHSADIRADLYSLGCTLYYLLAGHPPFPKGTLVEKLAAHRRDTPRPLTELRRDVPPELAALVARLLAKSPAERFQTPADVAQALVPFLRSAEADAKSPSAKPQRRWRLAAAAAVLGIMLLAAVVVYRIRTDKGELVIKTDADDVEVLIRQKGKEVTILDLRTRQKVELRSGEYVVELGKGGEGLAVSSKEITIKRGEKTIVEVHLEATVPGEAHLAESPPGPADKLRAEDIPPYELAVAGGGDPKQAPPGLVAILGDSRMKHWNNIIGVAFSPDGKRIASGGWDMTVKLWDFATGDQLHTLQSHTAAVDSVVFSPDGKMVASCSADRTIKLWDVAGGRLLKTLIGHPGGVTHVAFRPDGKRLASASGDARWDGTVKLWDVATGDCVQTLTKHPKGSGAVAFSPDGSLLASGHRDGLVQVWQLSTGKLLKALSGHTDFISSRALAFHPQAGILVSGSADRTLKVWDATTWQELRTLQEHPSGVSAVAFSRDGQTMVSGSNDGTVILWDGAARKQQRTLRDPHFPWMNSLALSPDGQTVAVPGYSEVMLWDASAGRPREMFRDDMLMVLGVAVSPNGRWLASGSFDYKVRLWDLASRKALHVFEGSGQDITSVAFSPDGKWLAWAARDNDVRLCNLESGRKVRTLRGHTEGVTRVNFSPDSRMLASSGYGFSPKLWDIEKGQELHSLQGHTDAVNAVAFSPDGKTAATAGRDRTIRLWDTATGKELRILEGHVGQVREVAFRPDGRVLASVSFEGTGRLWDVTSGKVLHTLRIGDSLETLMFSPDGRTLATTRIDGKVRFWDAYTGAAGPVLTLGPAGGSVERVAFTPDGRHLVTANYNGTIYVLRLAPPRK